MESRSAPRWRSRPAPDDPRISGVVAVATFSSLEEIARDRVGKVASDGQLREALAMAEREGRFRAADVSPFAAAPRIHVPVLLAHGTDDAETRPEHSRRVFAALAGPKRLELIEGAGHDDALVRGWASVQDWIVARGGAT